MNLERLKEIVESNFVGFELSELTDMLPELIRLAEAGQELRNTKDIYFCDIEYIGKGPCSHCDALAVYDSSTKEVS